MPQPFTEGQEPGEPWIDYFTKSDSIAGPPAFVQAVAFEE